MYGPAKTYVAEVKEVHSGDDLVLMVDLGFDVFKKVRARLKGVDTPDAYKESSGTDAGKVRDFVKRLTGKKRCRVEIHSINSGGWVISLYLGSNSTECLNDLLISKGYIFRG